jgi:hypothetical protein
MARTGGVWLGMAWYILTWVLAHIRKRWLGVAMQGIAGLCDAGSGMAWQGDTRERMGMQFQYKESTLQR